jgi:mevalonate kinase
MMTQFPAKILLFGEYAIVHGGSGLAIPYPEFTGSLEFANSYNFESGEKNSNLSIRQLQAYLQQNSDLFPGINLHQLKSDLDDGLYFRSNIPRGSGLGSSGALVAALYQRFGSLENKEPRKIREELSTIESYFHGSSSGTDPLVSLLKKPVIVRQNTVELLPNWNTKLLGLSLYLVDTGISSKTLRLVDWFNARMQNLRFRQAALEEFFIFNEALITAAKNHQPVNMSDLHAVSRYQMETLYPMVPESFRPHFFYGLEQGDFAFKLCGSGGGGFMLCFTKDETVLENYLQHEKLRFVRII